jgi:hypothetical protein
LRRVAHGRIATVLVLGTLAAGCGQVQGEFAGGIYKGRVFICKHAGRCRQLRYPISTHEPVYVVLRDASTGKRYGSLAVDNDGRFGSAAPPGTYAATLDPAHLHGLPTNAVRITISRDHTVVFDLAYGRR